MTEPMQWLKSDLAQRGKRQKDLSIALNMDYDKLNRIVNRFDREPWDFQMRVRRVLALWDEQTKERARV